MGGFAPARARARCFAAPAIAVLLGASAFAVEARGDADRYALSYQRGPGADACLDADAFARSVTARVGRSFVDPASSRRIEARVEHREGALRWAARVTVDGGAERNLESSQETCGDLGEALVLVVALIVDPDAAMRAPTVEPSAAPGPAPPAVAPPPPEPPPSRSGPASPRAAPRAPFTRSWPIERIEQGAVVVAGVLPRTTFAARSALSLRLPRAAPLGVAVTYGLSSFENESGYDARESAFYATLLGCPRLIDASHLALSICGGIDLGRLSTSASTPPTFSNRAFSAARPIVDLGGRAEAALRPAPRVPIEVVAGLDGRAVLLRENLLARAGLSPKAELSPAAVAVDLSVAFRFP